MSEVLKLHKLQKIYSQGGEDLAVLKGVNLTVDPGEMIALVGPSGSGKSTLLHLIGLLDSPSSGQIVIQGQDAAGLKDHERTRIRRESMGFVYQFHYLQPEFSALENVMMPQLIAGKKKKEAAERAESLLSDLGLAARLEHRPARLSGGEQQRVAIARALANGPGLILADEPTGNLDPETSDGVFDMLIDLVRNHEISAIIATHNMDLADRMDRVMELSNGHLMAL